MVVCTIGFAKKNLKEFIARLKSAGVKKIIDVRLNNTSQLAGYAKKEDLEYILSLVGIEYEHRLEFAPTEELLKNFKNKKISWTEYEQEFSKILFKRDPSRNKNIHKGAVCLLCSEDNANECHRRLIAEYYFMDKPKVKIIHL